MIALVAFAALTIPSALAGTNDEELMFAEIPTVYTAARHEQTVTEAPAAVTVITHDDIVKYGYRTLADALESVPGLYITDNHGVTVNFGVRGLQIPDVVNTRISFLLNGLPVVDKYWSQFLTELIPDMMDAIDRIEVIKGPGSALYGDNALVAVINIITRKGHNVNGAIVSGEGGSDPSGRGVFTYGQQLTNGLDLFLSGHYESDNGQDPSFGGVGRVHGVDEHELHSVFLNADYKELAFQLWYAGEERHIPLGTLQTIVGDDRAESDHSWHLADLRWHHEIDDTKSFSIRTYSQEVVNRDTLPQDFGIFLLTHQTVDDRWVGEEAQFDWSPIEKNLITLGSVFEYHWTSMRGFSDGSAGNRILTAPGGNDNFAYWAIYGQDEFHVLPTLSLTGGLRYDSFPETGRTSLSPRAGLVWNASKETTLKLLFGNAHRQPSAGQLDFPAQSGQGPQNSDIQPESIRTYEFILEEDLKRGLFGRASIFYNDIDNLIGTASGSPLILGNLGDVHTEGVETELTKKFTNGMRGFVNGTWQESSSKEGVDVNSPTWIGNLGVVYPIIGDKLSVSLRENYVSSRATFIPGVSTDDAFLTDVTISSVNWIRNWSFNLSVKNLLDERYETPGSRADPLNTLPGTGRTIYLRTTYRF